MNNTAKNVLKVACVMVGAGLTMLGNIMGNGDKKNDAKINSGAEQK